MRYRPFGRSGNAVSAVALNLDSQAVARGPSGLRSLVYAALEHGVNTFHLASADPVLAEQVGLALAPVDRNLVFVVARLGQNRSRAGIVRDFSAETLTGDVDRLLSVSGLGHLDLALLDEPQASELSQAALNALKAQRATGRMRLLGVAGEAEVTDAYVSTNAFDVLATPFHVNSPWAVRNRIRAAVERDMAVIAYGFYPAELNTPQRVEALSKPVRKGLFGLGGGARQTSPLDGAGTFSFLHQTPGWTAEEICLAYALTEPVISTVLIEALDDERLGKLTDVPERSMPPGLPAQIEMARFSIRPQQASA